MKCVAYVRTSSQKNKDANVLKQMEEIKTFISENNWELDSVYTDIGSGSKTNKNLLEMIEDAQQGKFDAIVTVDPSRILRNTDLSNVIGKLRESNKVHLITVDKRINTILNNDITILNNYAYINDCESKVMSQRIKDGIKPRRNKLLRKPIELQD